MVEKELNQAKRRTVAKENGRLVKERTRGEREERKSQYEDHGLDSLQRMEREESRRKETSQEAKET